MTNDEFKLEVDVTLQRQDYLHACIWLLLRKWTLKILILLAVCHILTVIGLIMNKSGSSKMLLTIIVFPSIIFFLFFNIYLGVRRNFSSSKSAQQSIHYTFTREGIELLSLTSSGRTMWENILKVQETKYTFLLFVSRIQMFLIPKRCFNNGDDVSEFKQMLSLYLGSRAKLKK